MFTLDLFLHISEITLILYKTYKRGKEGILHVKEDGHVITSTLLVYSSKN